MLLSKPEDWVSCQFWQWLKPFIYTFFEREMLMQEMPQTLTLGMPTHWHYYSNYIYIQALLLFAHNLFLGSLLTN